MKHLNKTYSIEHILSLIKTKDPRKRQIVNLDGIFINLSTKPLITFKLYGTTCLNCGLEGLYFRLCRQLDKGINRVNHFLQLIGKNSLGKEVKLTCDHKIAIADGGSRYSVKNFQTLCFNCNCVKASNKEIEFRMSLKGNKNGTSF